MARSVGQLEHPFSKEGLDAPVQEGRLIGFWRELISGKTRS